MGGIAGKIVAGVLGGGNQYYQSVRRMLGAYRVGYWPIWDTSGAVAQDVSGNGYSGRIAGLTLANGTAPSGKPCPYFPGVGAGTVDVWSAGIVSSFPKQEGAFFAWFKGDSIWSDATERYLFLFQADINNYYTVYRTTANNTLRVAGYTGGVAKLQDTNLYPSGWINIGMVWSKAGDYIKTYINAVPVVTFTGLGSFTGTMNTLRIGSLNDTLQNWKGWASDGILVSTPLTDAQIKFICNAPTVRTVRVKRMAYLGDSITAAASPWGWMVANEYNNGSNGYINHAVAGSSIMGHMDAQTTEAANDDADYIIIALGTNDSETGDALRAEYEENLNELKASNPRAAIYCMGILPRTDMTGVATKNTRIQTAATNAGCTYWDTPGWIDPAADTSDGLHLNETGKTKVTAEVLARLP